MAPNVARIVDNDHALDALDRLFLERAYELAARAWGNTSPNPMVGAVVVRDGHVLGEGYHHRAGLAHAEVNALAQAGDARGATIYVSLEPCNHVGRTPACSGALLDAQIARVVIGALDPNPKTDGGGVRTLRERGVRVDIADDAHARRLIERFGIAMRGDRPYSALKMAMSLDGYITSKPGVQEWLTSEATHAYVRELRIAHDAVMVGAGTVRIDDPQLTVRPPYHRVRPYTRVVVCERDTVPERSRIFAEATDYDRTIVLAPAGVAARFDNLRDRAEVLFAGKDDATQLDLVEAMRALRRSGVQSVLCEGGPTLAGRLLAENLIDRVHWAIAPRFLRGDESLPVLAGASLVNLSTRVRVDTLEHVGDDVMLSGTVQHV